MRILIIGAGPIGCYVARLLKEKSRDMDLVIIEEHANIGRPLHCAGLVSKEALSEIRLNLGNGFVLNSINGAEFFLNGDSFKINRKNVAFVIDREKFDCALGTDIKVDFNTKFVGIEREDDGYLVETDRGAYRADIVVGADGANSLLRKIGGFKEDIEYLRGAQFRMKYNKCNKDTVRVYLKEQFFAWIIPENEGIVRAGIISDNPYRDLTNFLKENFIDGEIVDKFAGVVPLGKCETQKENLALVGDAACQVKPLTHGGIYYGMRCAEILVDCIINNRLSDYEREWFNRFGREMSIGLKVKDMYRRLNYNNLEKIFVFLKNNLGLLEQFGDFENHSKVISAIIKNPKLQIFLGRILIDMVKDFGV